MQVVVLKSPKCLRGLLRRLFGIKKEREERNNEHEDEK